MADSLWAAAQRGDRGAVAGLLGGGAADVDAADGDGHTALTRASAQGHEEVALLLLRHGAAVEAADGRGSTALLWAAAQGHARVAQLLLRHGAAVEAANSAGNTAFHLACKRVARSAFNPGGAALLRALVQHGADTEVANSAGLTGADILAAGAHGEPWLAHLQQLRAESDGGAVVAKPGAPGWASDAAAAARGEPPASAPAAILPDAADAVVSPELQLGEGGGAGLRVLLSFRRDELDSFASKLRRRLEAVHGFGQLFTVAERAASCAPPEPGQGARRAGTWVRGLTELFRPSRGTLAAAGEHPRPQVVARRAVAGLPSPSLLHLLNLAASKGSAAAAVADAVAAELLQRQMEAVMPAPPDPDPDAEEAAGEDEAHGQAEEKPEVAEVRWVVHAADMASLMRSVSELALLEHIGPMVSAAEQRVLGTGEAGDSAAAAIAVASEALVVRPSLPCFETAHCFSLTKAAVPSG